MFEMISVPWLLFHAHKTVKVLQSSFWRTLNIFRQILDGWFMDGMFHSSVSLLSFFVELYIISGYLQNT